jgi:hypothetical protein
MGNAVMRLVAQCRLLAIEYRRLAAQSPRRDDKEALELLAIGWDKIADRREAMLHKRSRSDRLDESNFVIC